MVALSLPSVNLQVVLLITLLITLIAMNLHQAINQLLPNLKSTSLYTKADLLADVYLEAATNKVNPEDTEQLEKIVKKYAFRQYRVKYPRHSTANFTAEDLEQYCRHMVVTQKDSETIKPSLFDYLRQAYQELYE
jgi:hypothetical protein